MGTKTTRKSREERRSRRTSASDGPDTSSIASRIKPVQSLPFKVSAVIYGRSGSGKTTFGASFPKPILLLDAREEGTDSIVGEEGVDVLPLETFDDFDLIYYYLVSEEGKKYNTVIIDTLTQVQDMLLENIVAEGTRPMATKQDWGRLSQELKAWIIHYRDLPQNVVFLCQDRRTETEDEDEDQVLQEVGPRLSPSIASSLNAAVKMIGQTYIKEVTKTVKGEMVSRMEYRLRIGPHPLYLTKIRTSKGSYVPNSIANPTYDDVVKIMKGEFEPPVKKSKKDKE